MFRGAPIENMSDLNVAPEARYDERTSLLMREIGQITGLSPKKLEHIVTGYTGTIGAYVVGICDAIVRASGDYGAAPAIRADLKLFGSILRLKNILTAFDDFAGNEILSERDFQDYQSLYLNLHAQFRSASPWSVSGGNTRGNTRGQYPGSTSGVNIRGQFPE